MTDTADTIRILLCDDHALFRNGIRQMLASQKDFDVVGEAEEGEQAIAETARLMPDVVLMDVRMPPGMDGVRAAARIKTLHPETNVLMVTSYETHADLGRALQAGATGYIPKNVDPDDLYRAVRDVASGRPSIHPALASPSMRQLYASNGTTVTGRELEILELAQAGLSNAEIAARLFVSMGTVKQHMHHIQAKLGANNRTHAIALAVRQRIIPDEPWQSFPEI